MKKSWYQWVVEAISAVILASIVVLSVIFAGGIFRMLWEGFMLGWNMNNFGG